jgi:hypothetical protein
MPALHQQTVVTQCVRCFSTTQHLLDQFLLLQLLNDLLMMQMPASQRPAVTQCVRCFSTTQHLLDQFLLLLLQLNEHELLLVGVQSLPVLYDE